MRSQTTCGPVVAGSTNILSTEQNANKGEGRGLSADKNATLWRMLIVPRGGAEISPDGTVRAADPTSEQRTAVLIDYDSLTVDAHQFEKLWPKRDRIADEKRRKLLRRALQLGLDKDEILKLSGLKTKWQLQLLRIGLAAIVSL